MNRSIALLFTGLGCAGLAVIGWQPGQATAPTSNGAITALTGPDLFHAKGCAVCHIGPSNVGIGMQGPSLADVSTWAASRVPELGAREYLDQSIRDPSVFRSAAVSSDGTMPGLVFSDAEIDALVDYLLQG